MVKPKASFVLAQNQIKDVCEWVKQLRFPDGYVSNITQGVNVDEGKIHGMKSHDLSCIHAEVDTFGIS